VTIDLQELTGVDRAVLDKKVRPAARLPRSGDGVEFSYLPEYVGEGGAAVTRRSTPRSSGTATALSRRR
jgi:hypothetical protein